MTGLGISYLALTGFGLLTALVFAIQAAIIRSDRYVLGVVAACAASFAGWDFGLAMTSEASGAPLPPPMWAIGLTIGSVSALSVLSPLTVWAMLDLRFTRPRQVLLWSLLAVAAAWLGDTVLYLWANGPRSWEALQSPRGTNLGFLGAVLGAIAVGTWWVEGLWATRARRPLGLPVLLFGLVGMSTIAHAGLIFAGVASPPVMHGINALPFLVFLQAFSTQRLLAALKTGARPAGDFSGYQVIRKLGAGGMGEVFLARRKGPAGFLREVVLKTLQAGVGHDASVRERFLVEARVAAQLRHPNIIDVYDLGERPNGYFLVMELIDGITLDEAIGRAREQGVPIPIAVVAEVGVQMCRALSFAHAAGVIHRDIKPQNVMVSTAGTVKLIDFGVAQAQGPLRPDQALTDAGAFSPVTPLTVGGGVVGTPGYLAPERLGGHTATAASDLFALGVLLYKLVALQPPFPSHDSVALIRAVINGEFERLPKVRADTPPALAEVIERCLAPEARLRPSSATAVQVALETCLEDHRVDLAAWVASPSANVAPTLRAEPEPLQGPTLTAAERPRDGRVP